MPRVLVHNTLGQRRRGSRVVTGNALIYAFCVSYLLITTNSARERMSILFLRHILVRSSYFLLISPTRNPLLLVVGGFFHRRSPVSVLPPSL